MSDNTPKAKKQFYRPESKVIEYDDINLWSALDSNPLIFS